MMRKITILFLALLYAVPAIAQSNANIAPNIAPAANHMPDANYIYVRSENPLQDRLFYIFTLIENDAKLKSTIKNDKAFSDFFAKQEVKINSTNGCQPQPQCINNSYLWSAAEIDEIATNLNKIPDANFTNTANAMRRTGYYIMYQNQNDKALVINAWRDAANAINNIINVYGNGEKPLYPEIDSINFDITSKSYANLLASYNNIAQHMPRDAFYSAPLNYSLGLLYINRREDAVNFAPSEDIENTKAAAAVKQTNFSKFKYSAILVLGSGPNKDGIRLSEYGKLRLMTAAQRYKEGLAPFIIVSGGTVHPANTQYNEAVEMRRELVERYKIPQSAIFIEPHARHTTTNFRNAVRIMFRYGIPLDKDAIVDTSEPHSQYVESDKFNERCRRELGYMPIKIGKRISDFDVSFRPDLKSLQINATDPLDP